VCVSILSSPVLAKDPPKLPFDGSTGWEHVKVLADDNMEGRETGSAGLRRAQAYVVEQLKKNGIEPAGTDGYYQPVKFIERQVIEKDSSAFLIREGKSEPLTPGDDILFSTRSNTGENGLSASLVFVGYGLQITEKQIDDLAGQDLSGKMVVYINGSTSDV